jgi:hypothetical protein
MTSLKTGDLISSTSAPPSTGILSHKGVVLVEDEQVFILHNTPMKTNEFGGGVVIDTLEDYKSAGREIEKVKTTNLTSEEIKRQFEEIKHLKFNWFTWNCDHFVTQLADGSKKSIQLRTVILIVGILSAFYFLKFRNKK